MNKEIEIVFKDVSDFRRRIARLWQDQKEDETYNFVFLDKETEEEFNDLISRFSEG